MSDGKPRRLNLSRGETASPPVDARPEQAGKNDAPPVPDVERPRRLAIPERTPAPEPSQPSLPPRRLNIPERVPAPAPTSAPVAIQPPRRLNIADRAPPPPPPEAPKSRVELLIEKAQQIETSVRPERIKGRIDTILRMSVTDILDWGERNLEPLRDTSSKRAKIVADLQRIDAVGWMEKTKEASSRKPGLMDRFSPPPPPSYFEGMLAKARGELLAYTRELEKMKTDFRREVTDLHLDALAMLVCANEFADDTAKHMADNRGRSLLNSHAAAAMLQQTIEMSMQQCAQHIQQIDDLLNTAIPAWKTAFAGR